MFNMVLNKLLNEDCIQFMKKMEAKSVDHIITDIPYDGVNRKDNGLRKLDKSHADILTFNLEKFIVLCTKITKDKIFIFCGQEQVSILNKLLNKNGFKTGQGIWVKSNPSPMNGQHIWLSGNECIVPAQRDNLDKNMENVILKSTSGRSKIHPTEKPVVLFDQIITNYTQECDIIYDPCAGSAASCVSIFKNNRNFIANELQKEHFENGDKRIKEYINNILK